MFTLDIYCQNHHAPLIPSNTLPVLWKHVRNFLFLNIYHNNNRKYYLEKASTTVFSIVHLFVIKLNWGRTKYGVFH